jgi:hypothetical protein
MRKASSVVHVVQFELPGFSQTVDLLGKVRVLVEHSPEV